MITFNVSEEDVNNLYKEQALKALEILEMVKENSETHPYADGRMTIVFTPLSNCAIKEALFVLNMEQKELIKDLGGNASVRKHIENMSNTEDKIVYVDGDIFENFIEYVEKRISALIDDDTEAPKEEK